MECQVAATVAQGLARMGKGNGMIPEAIWQGFLKCSVNGQVKYSYHTPPQIYILATWSKGEAGEVLQEYFTQNSWLKNA